MSTSRFLLLAVALVSVAGCSVPDGSSTATSAPSPSMSAPTATPAAVMPTSAPPAVAASTPAAPTQVTGVALPDPALTPGELFPNVGSAQVCTSGWASAHRHVTASQYHEVYAAYNIAYPEPTGTYELDHLIPLELGGDNANANLWPEASTPVPGFHEKDRLENVLHDMVCSGQLALAAAQQAIAGNWYAAYQHYVGS